MAFGHLTVIAGPMYAGKTEDLVKEVLYRRYFPDREGGEIGIFRPSFDTRRGEKHLVTHDGNAVAAQEAASTDDLFDVPLRFVFFDEVQFFTAPQFQGDFVEAIRDLRKSGTDVVCAGLDMDYLGRGFEITATLMSEASDIRRRTARCSICNGPATHTSRHVQAQDRLLLGSGNEYSAMCAEHWFSSLSHSQKRERP
jgi:thymidine kinase